VQRHGKPCARGRIQSFGDGGPQGIRNTFYESICVAVLAIHHLHRRTDQLPNESVFVEIAQPKRIVSGICSVHAAWLWRSLRTITTARHPILVLFLPSLSAKIERYVVQAMREFLSP